MNKKIIIISIIIVVLVVLYPAMKNTLFWAGDAYGLILLSQQDEEDLSYNPFNRDVSFVSPSMAVWILKNMDYPYSTCSFAGWVANECDKPVIMAAGHSLLGVKDKNRETLLLEIIRHMVARGEPLNERYKGKTCVHDSILNNNPEYLEILLSAGADPTIAVEIEGKEYSELNAFDLFSYLESKNPGKRKTIGEILAKYKPNKTN
jgi:hypothetical protein